MKMLDRRTFLSLVTAGAAGAWVRPAMANTRPRVAAIVTEYRHRSHGDVIVGRFLNGYHTNGVYHEPRTSVVSMYIDQFPANDMSRDISHEHGVPIYPSIADALTLGGPALAVDAVLLIGEHGDYPSNAKGQKLYPRFEMYQEIIEVFRRGGRSVPVFCDKHLSYSWDKAKRMYDTAVELGVPFMAGSSIPVTIRVPALEIPRGSPLTHAVAVGYGGTEVYGFHTLEVLQCMVERRAGGETGIASVETLSGGEVWRWRDGDGRWSAPLLDAALGVARGVREGTMDENVRRPVLFLLEYNDGLQAAVYLLDGHFSGWTFAGRVADRPEPVATQFGSPGIRDLPHFDGLVYAIEEMFVTGRPLYPVERTLLVSGALDLLMDSLYRGHPLRTPELRVEYEAPLHDFFQRA
jgi:hypothetical protein